MFFQKLRDLREGGEGRQTRVGGLPREGYRGVGRDTQRVVSIILFGQQVCQYEYSVTRITIRLYC